MNAGAEPGPDNPDGPERPADRVSPGKNCVIVLIFPLNAEYFLGRYYSPTKMSDGKYCLATGTRILLPLAY